MKHSILKRSLDESARRIAANGNAPTCMRCGGLMRRGVAIEQTYQGTPDFPGCAVVTLSPGGPGRLIECLKCTACGHSMTPNVAGNRLARQGQSELTGVLGGPIRSEKE